MLRAVFGAKPPTGEPPRTVSRVHEAVRAQMPEADTQTQHIVAAVAGLLGCVAFADGAYSAVEETQVRAELGRIRGLSRAGATVVAEVLRADIVAISTMDSHVWARELRAHADAGCCVDVLDVLMDLAAADESITLPETNLLRRLAFALGLGDGDYLAAQARHRDKLAVLRPP